MLSNSKSANYNKLKNVLKEVFQLDQADLDFGIYRIMNQKRNEINDFLENRLLPQVSEILTKSGDGDNIKVQQELDEAVKQAKSLGVDADSLPKVIELRNKLTSSTSIDSLEQEVYSHLANFFKRYYKDGDFISLRRYKKDVYAIPYEGEEVKLHWANHDQYYIKTSEYLKNYGFKLPNGKSVKFELKEASTEQNNNKEQSGKERRFQLYSELPYEVSDDGSTLIVNFTYEEHDKKVKQDKLNGEAVDTLVNGIPQEFHAILEKRPTEKNKNRTLLEKHILDFTARNSFDYFIHKDLGGFLTRELDFYIKNEVLYLDDINTDNEQDFTSQLSKVKAIKQVAQKIITFLAQLENFQKKLWLKKKFVVSTNYCITLDRIPENYYNEICNNKAQLEEWKELFKIDQIKGDILNVAYSEPLSLDFLKSQPYLVLDTKFFSQDFKEKLLAEFDNIDQQITGTLINSENFQANSLLQTRYRNKIKGIYVDPPYNAKSSEILYKNTFKHSSWLSFIHNRISISKGLLKSNNGVFTIAIDENEQENLGLVLSNIFGDYNKTCISVIHNASGIQGENFSYTHEFAYFMYPNGGRMIGQEQRGQDEADVRNLRDVTGEDSKREAAANCFYPIIIKDNKIIGFGEVSPDSFHPTSMNIEKEDGSIEVYPIDPQGIERKWRFARQTVESIKNELSVSYIKNRNVFDIKRTKTTFNFKTVWSDSKYFANNQGTQILNNIVGKGKFSFPKSLYTVMDSIRAIEYGDESPIILDYFAGSGTTAHATINLIREDGKLRKFILVEMGTYFETVTKPRTLKVSYSEVWNNEHPQDNNGISQFIRYQDLESYEDVLNNLSLQKNKEKENLLLSPDFNDDYVLSYMLDVESRDSLLNIDAFKNPFGYKLNITRNNESQQTVIDLVETFNYLIGLHVKTIQTIKGFKVITGTTNERDEETLVIWRNIEEKSNKDLNDFFTKMEFSTRDSEFQRIYVNGDNHLENLKTGDDNWKVVLIEEEFMKRMFDIQDV
jgi:adenine-specific DNA-methyltransferase